MDLSSFIGQLFGKAMRIAPPKSAHRLLTTFLGLYEDVNLGQPEVIEVRACPTEVADGYWADSEGAWSETVNLRWDEGAWGE